MHIAFMIFMLCYSSVHFYLFTYLLFTISRTCTPLRMREPGANGYEWRIFAKLLCDLYA